MHLHHTISLVSLESFKVLVQPSNDISSSFFTRDAISSSFLDMVAPSSPLELTTMC